MSGKNYYQSLSLNRDATQQQVAQQYQKMVLRWHPKFAKQDQKTAHHHFCDISEAYQVLSDPIKRSFYDKYGWEKLKEGLFSQGQLKGGYRFANNPDQIFERFFLCHNAFQSVVDKQLHQRGSLFSNAFGAMKHSNSPERVKFKDLIVEVPCSLNELYKGVAKRVQYQRKVLNPDGRTTSMKDQSRLLEIRPGYTPQTKIEFVNEGHETVHRTKSKLIFRIQPIHHQNYERCTGNPDDLIYSTDIQLRQALNCKSLEVITLDARKLKVSVDQIINPKTLIHVGGEGMPKINDPKSKGDLYIRFNILFPKALSQQKKAELRKLLS